MYKYNKSNKKGFTLIELLIVISIIGVLSSIVLSELSVARIRARDAKRKEDSRQLSIALSLYYDDNGTYPANSSTASGDWPIAFKNALHPYLSSVAKDPTQNDLNHAYYAMIFTLNNSSCRNHYVIWISLENPSNMPPSAETCGFSSSFGWAFIDLGAP